MGEPVRVTVVGMHGGESFGRAARAALDSADVVIGSPRHLEEILAGERVSLTSVDAMLDLAADRHQRGQRVCLVASGDPGFFGIVRKASARFPLAVHPAPSSVALAFARLGTNWEDAAVVSAHGRPIEQAIEIVLRSEKAAVLTSPDQPPELLGKALLAAGCGARDVAVCSRLGEADENIHQGGLDDLAGGTFDPLSVVVLRAPAPDTGMGLVWGTPDVAFAHRAGMITKAEVRAVALGKLRLLPAGVLWDVGAGSGSVAVECARLRPGLSVYAVERAADALAHLTANAAGTGVRVVAGEAPDVLASLPDPDHAFVGGGGLAVLDAVLARLRPGGAVVATYAALDRAVAAARRLGHMVQVSVSRAVPVGEEGALRLAAENPVFVCWGPDR